MVNIIRSFDMFDQTPEKPKVTMPRSARKITAETSSDIFGWSNSGEKEQVSNYTVSVFFFWSGN